MFILNNKIYKLIIEEANYIISTNKTIRDVAKYMVDMIFPETKEHKNE